MIIFQSLKFATAKLSAKHIDLPHLEAEILLSSIIKKPAEFLLAHGETKLSPGQFAQYRGSLKRRLKGEPIAYLTGRKEFYGLDFLVNQNVLIPRPETELMIDETMKLVTNISQPITLLDVGTGSGNIIITLAILIKNYELKITNYKLTAVDISKKVLAVARKNSRLHGVNQRIKFFQGNLLNPLINHSKFIIRNSKLVILANLPYGWPAWKNNCSQDTIGLKFEPSQALFTDKNGLGLYEKLFIQIRRLHLGNFGITGICALCEFDPRQTKMIKKLIKQELPQAKVQIKKDLAGLNRLAIIKL
jgi:release factor glutamine methyltransferase